MQSEAWNKVANDVSFNLEIDIELFKAHIPLSAKVLDFGCGYGRITDQLFSQGYKHLQGLDSSLEMIKKGEEQFPHLSLSVSSGDSIPYPDSSFDAVVMCAVLTCIPETKDRVDVISELNRVLKPDGLIHVSEFCNDKENIFKSKLGGVVMRHSTPDNLLSLFNDFHCLNYKRYTTATMGGNSAEAVSYLGSKNTYR